MLIDSHAHLNFPEYHRDLEEVLARAKEAKVRKIISVGTDYQGSLSSLAVAEKWPSVFSTIGLHPSASIKNLAEELRALKEIAVNSPKVVAVGECGLDYFRLKKNLSDQRELFISQLDLAEELKLPVIIHIRNGDDEKAALDAYQILKKRSTIGVIHCFTLSEEWAERFLGLGFFLGFTGVVTYPKTVDLEAAVKITPLEKILLETDSPYLAPQKNRGTRNEPAYLTEIARRIAMIKELSDGEIAESTTNNTKRLFRI